MSGILLSSVIELRFLGKLASPYELRYEFFAFSGLDWFLSAWCSFEVELDDLNLYSLDDLVTLSSAFVGKLAWRMRSTSSVLAR